MSLGATTSAPASTWLTAVRARSSSVSSLSTSPSCSTPQWPWLVYSQRQTSVTSVRPGTSARSARSARCTMPSASQAPLPSSSFSSGMPNSSTARTPERTRAAAPRGRSRRRCAARSRRGPRRGARRPRRGRRRAASRRRRARGCSRGRARAGLRAAEPPQAGDGKGRHRGKGTSAGLPRGSSTSSSTGMPSPSQGSKRIRSAKNSQIARAAAMVGRASSTPGMP